MTNLLTTLLVSAITTMTTVPGEIIPTLIVTGTTTISNHIGIGTTTTSTTTTMRAITHLKTFSGNCHLPNHKECKTLINSGPLLVNSLRVENSLLEA